MKMLPKRLWISSVLPPNKGQFWEDINPFIPPLGYAPDLAFQLEEGQFRHSYHDVQNEAMSDSLCIVMWKKLEKFYNMARSLERTVR